MLNVSPRERRVESPRKVRLTPQGPDVERREKSEENGQLLGMLRSEHLAEASISTRRYLVEEAPIASLLLGYLRRDVLMIC